MKQIDVRKIVAEKAGSKARYVPGFVYRWLEKTIHQEGMNIYLARGLEGVPFCKGVIEYMGAKVIVEGIDNLPRDGRRYSFISNHPLGAIDGVALLGIIGENYPEGVKFMANNFLTYLDGLAPMCIPVNKIGNQSRALSTALNEAFESDLQILTFPAGKCARKVDGVVTEMPWKKTFMTLSRKNGRDIVPIHFVGENSEHFYNVDKWCKRLGIKFNLAMLYLPDEMFRTKGKTFVVKIGRPVPLESLPKNDVEATQVLRDVVLSL